MTEYKHGKNPLIKLSQSMRPFKVYNAYLAKLQQDQAIQRNFEMVQELDIRRESTRSICASGATQQYSTF